MMRSLVISPALTVPECSATFPLSCSVRPSSCAGWSRLGAPDPCGEVAGVADAVPAFSPSRVDPWSEPLLALSRVRGDPLSSDLGDVVGAFGALHVA